MRSSGVFSLVIRAFSFLVIRPPDHENIHLARWRIRNQLSALLSYFSCFSLNCCSSVRIVSVVSCLLSRGSNP